MTRFALSPGQKVVFIGDSITACGRRGTVHMPYGNGYVSLVRSFLLARYPEYNLTIENRGIGGDTIRHLKARWAADVLAENPDVLSVFIGINDIWRAITGRPAEAVPLDEYEAIYRELLTETLKHKGETLLILVDPYVIETNHKDPFRERMDAYVACVHRLAAEFHAISVRTQEAFDKALRRQPSTFWSQDRIHPWPHGHAVIARAFLKAINYKF